MMSVINKKASLSLLLVLILIVSFASAAFAATSASYDGSFVTSVTTINSIDISNGKITVDHNQSNTLGRSVSIDAMKKGTFGYSNEATIMTGVGDGRTYFSYSGLSNGTYKLRFRETSGECGTCSEIHINGKFWMP
jgi:Cu/Ag efflux protein CusF